MMTNLRKTKTGRRASDAGPDKKLAKIWVDLFRKAQASPGGMLCLNPEDEPELHTWLDGNDPAHLLWMLTNFAEHGTFVSQDEHGIREFLIRLEARRRLAKERLDRQQKGRKRNEEKALLSPIEKIASDMCMSKRTLERILGRSAK